MAKRYFKPKKKKELTLSKIIVAIVVVLAVAYGGMRLAANWPGAVSRAEATAPAGEALTQARALYNAGELENAQALLEKLTDGKKSGGPDALMLLAEVEEKQGDPQAAADTLKSAIERHGSSADYPELAARYARALEKAGQTQQATQVYEQLQQTAPPEKQGPALLGLGREKERAGEFLAARDLYHEALGAAPFKSNLWYEAADALGRLNATLMFDAAQTPESRMYIVQPGDTMTAIGMKLNTTQGLLTRANGIDDPSKLRLNQQLKHTPKDFRILIERSSCNLYLLDKDGLFKLYKTGLGMPGHETALGTYTIGNKQKDPTWFQPGGEAIPPGDPKNELGTRWMPLVPIAEGLPTDLGIHGTIAPETIGDYQSHGCPRMHKEDVEELYDLVVRSTPVEIVEVVEADQIH